MTNIRTAALGFGFVLVGAACSSASSGAPSNANTASASTTSTAGGGGNTGVGGSGGNTGAGGGDSTACPSGVAADFGAPCTAYAVGLQCSGGDEPTFTCTCQKETSGSKMWSCKTDQGAGGGGAVLSGISATVSAVPVNNNPESNSNSTSDILELSPSFQCSAVATDTFDCNDQGYAFVFAPGALKIGTFDLATLPGYHYMWTGTCSDGGGGPTNFFSGMLEITALDATTIEGSVTGLVLAVTGPTMVLPSFTFHADRCN